APGTIASLHLAAPLRISARDDRGSMTLADGKTLAVCPRRDWFASRDSHLGVMQRIVGGVNDESTRRAVELLSNVSEFIEPTDAYTAEITKALENALLHTAVAVPTELAMNMKN